ncbi:MAG: FGGY-family carbohydrate kinase [Spirochaetales bacterium]|nr:FGGY-family carbohydrate kinase [Spirochaetales bacterium]
MILAVDIGTTSLKGGLFSVDGTLLHLGRKVFSRPGKEGLDPDLWIRGFGEILNDFTQNNIDLTRIEGVVISGHGPTLVPLDREGQPIAPVLMWYDMHRGRGEGASLYLPLARWYRDTRPEAFGKTACFLGSSEYLLYQLTGVRQTLSSGTFFDPYIWTPEELRLNDLDESLFPPTSYLGDKSPARLSPQGAALTGLTPGIPVYGAGSDFFTSLLGAGAVTPGVICDRAGTSEGLNMIVPESRNHDHIRFLPHPSSRGNLCNGSVILSSTGALFEWYRRLTGQDDWPYARTMEGITAAGQERLPHFFPSLNDGGLWEFSGGTFLGLEPDMDRFCLGRAVLEAIGFALKRGLTLLEGEGGPASRIVTVGGQAKSPLWNRMKADMLNRKIEVPAVADAELLGGLVIFLTGEGKYTELKQASLDLYRTRETIEPENNDYYKRKFENYAELAQGIKGFYASCRPLMEKL